nr:hypothetical protein [Tanacetum cinerariifolium]
MFSSRSLYDLAKASGQLFSESGRCTVSVSSESEIFTSSGASLVLDIFHAEDCGAGGCFDLKASESCLFFLFRSKLGGGRRGS